MEQRRWRHGRDAGAGGVGGRNHEVVRRVREGSGGIDCSTDDENSSCGWFNADGGVGFICGGKKERRESKRVVSSPLPPHPSTTQPQSPFSRLFLSVWLGERMAEMGWVQLVALVVVVLVHSEVVVVVVLVLSEVVVVLVLAVEG
jgi:hypothetical protein